MVASRVVRSFRGRHLDAFGGFVRSEDKQQSVDDYDPRKTVDAGSISSFGIGLFGAREVGDEDHQFPIATIDHSIAHDAFAYRSNRPNRLLQLDERWPIDDAQPRLRAAVDGGPSALPNPAVACAAGTEVGLCTTLASSKGRGSKSQPWSV